MVVFSDAALQKTAGYHRRDDASSLQNMLTFADGNVFLKAKMPVTFSIVIRDPCSCLMLGFSVRTEM